MRFTNTAPAPNATPTTPPTRAAAPGLVPPPRAPLIDGYNDGGVCALRVASEWMGLVTPTPFSVQPKHGAPLPTGPLPSPTSPKPLAGQLACVSGPLPPILSDPKSVGVGKSLSV